MERVLHVIGSMNLGGAEQFIMNVYRTIDRKKIQFDFVLHEQNQTFFDDEIKRLGGKIYRVQKPNVKTVIAYQNWWKKFYKDHSEYKLVHGHIGSTAAIYLGIARYNGLITIAHSHNTAMKTINPKNIFWKLCSYPTRFISDYYFACSPEAACDRFGKKVSQSSKCLIIPNAIDSKKFILNDEQRIIIRDRYSIKPSDFVLGCIARLTEQKNHLFLLKIFKSILAINKNSKLIIIGGGEMYKDLLLEIKKLNLEDNVIMTGPQKDTAQFYSAMDAFCLPSLWEGFGIVFLEAQTSGLPCYTSSNASDFSDLKVGLFKRISLKEKPEYWATIIMENRYRDRNKTVYLDTINQGFDILELSKKLQKFYLNVIDKREI